MHGIQEYWTNESIKKKHTIPLLFHRGVLCWKSFSFFIDNLHVSYHCLKRICTLCLVLDYNTILFLFHFPPLIIYHPITWSHQSLWLSTPHLHLGQFMFKQCCFWVSIAETMLGWVCLFGVSLECLASLRTVGVVHRRERRKCERWTYWDPALAPQ